ncbi:MAG: TIGR00730 family Rossman fold protein [Bacteroidetes bacterium]|nr:TIGR00730 family Rossman fold protein [Bacteroidota bacterium]MDA1120069.1 TIGR00730 family Rossman fold protein [Bacteroidota bacterium]
MKSICVFCGSSKGKKVIFSEAAIQLGETLAARNISLVFGGGKIGLMGLVADACMKNGGLVTGIIPKFLAKDEIAHNGISELIVVQSMHERKLKMSQLADGFIALPGGFGTLEELCEILTWVQLDIINKPIGILNVDGYFDHLIDQFNQMVEEQLLKPANLKFFVQSDNVDELLSKMRSMKSISKPFTEKFI